MVIETLSFTEWRREKQCRPLGTKSLLKTISVAVYNPNLYRMVTLRWRRTLFKTSAKWSYLLSVQTSYNWTPSREQTPCVCCMRKDSGNGWNTEGQNPYQTCLIQRYTVRNMILIIELSICSTSLACSGRKRKKSVRLLFTFMLLFCLKGATSDWITC